MKKIISILSILIMISFIGGYSKTYNTSIETIYNYDDVKNSLIRFHVLANSDSKEDQTLKLKVKDEVINYLYPYLKNSKSLDESRKLLIEQENNVMEIADNVIIENGKKEIEGVLKEYNKEFLIVENEDNKIKIDNKNIATVKTVFDW